MEATLETAATGREGSILKKLLKGWSRRESRREDWAPEMRFDLEREDFPVKLLPFADHPLFWAAPQEARTELLTCAWLAYNRKAVDLEERIVGPACMTISRGELPGVEEPNVRAAARACFVDEGAHILMLHAANHLARVHRQLEHIRLAPTTMVTQLDTALAAESDGAKRSLLRLAAAVIAENSITDYLATLLQPNAVLQPLHRALTEWHRKDELAHAGMFRSILTLVHQNLDQAQKLFLGKSLLWAREQFYAVDWHNWQSLLQQLKFPNGERLFEEAQDNCRALARSAHFSAIQKLLPKVIELSLKTV